MDFAAEVVWDIFCGYFDPVFAVKMVPIEINYDCCKFKLTTASVLFLSEGENNIFTATVHLQC